MHSFIIGFLYTNGNFGISSFIIGTLLTFSLLFFNLSYGFIYLFYFVSIVYFINVGFYYSEDCNLLSFFYSF